jgi:hypothetical protein
VNHWCSASDPVYRCVWCRTSTPWCSSGTGSDARVLSCFTMPPHSLCGTGAPFSLPHTLPVLAAEVQRLQAHSAHPGRHALHWATPHGTLPPACPPRVKPSPSGGHTRSAPRRTRHTRLLSPTTCTHCLTQLTWCVQLPPRQQRQHLPPSATAAAWWRCWTTACNALLRCAGRGPTCTGEHRRCVCMAGWCAPQQDRSLHSCRNSVRVGYFRVGLVQQHGARRRWRVRRLQPAVPRQPPQVCPLERTSANRFITADIRRCKIVFHMLVPVLAYSRSALADIHCRNLVARPCASSNGCQLKG